MPRISETFKVEQPVTRVWDFFQDVPQVVTCMPGLELLEQLQPEVFRGRMKIKLGAVSAAFEGEATIVESNHAEHLSRIQGKGVDKKGGSRAQADFTYRLADIAGGTQVSVDAEINLSGPLAQFGRTSILNDVAHELTAQFASNLEAKLGASTGPAMIDAPTEPTPVAALDGGQLARSILRRRWQAFIRGLYAWFGIHD